MNNQKNIEGSEEYKALTSLWNNSAAPSAAGAVDHGAAAASQPHVNLPHVIDLQEYRRLKTPDQSDDPPEPA